MRIKMLRTRTGSPDGILVRTYVKGEHCEVADALAEVFIAEGWAKAAVTKRGSKVVEKPPARRRKKDQGRALENKSRCKIKK